MKYILKEKIPFTDYEVGHVFEASMYGRINMNIIDENHKIIARNAPYTTLQPYEILLMVKAGILEEYDDTFPKVGDYYWFIDSTSDVQGAKHLNWESDRYRIKTNNYFRTKEAAEARLKEIMGE